MGIKKVHLNVRFAAGELRILKHLKHIGMLSVNKKSLIL